MLLRLAWLRFVAAFGSVALRTVDVRVVVRAACARLHIMMVIVACDLADDSRPNNSELLTLKLFELAPRTHQ